MKQFKTQLEFAQDMINYYWGNKERLCNMKGTCSYTPISDKTEGCAIGRHLNKKLQILLDNQSFTGVSNKHIFDKLPKWMKNLGKPFLIKCQDLHDEEILTNKNIQNYRITRKLVFKELDNNSIRNS